MIPFPQSPEFALDAVFWWDIEFWNRSVGQTFVATDKEFSYAPFPNRTITPDWSGGLVPGTANAPAYVVFALNDPRYRLLGIRDAENIGLQVIVANRPYRAQWATRGPTTDGWAPAGKPVTVRIYSQSRRAELVRLALTLSAPQQAPMRYSSAPAVHSSTERSPLLHWQRQPSTSASPHTPSPTSSSQAVATPTSRKQGCARADARVRTADLLIDS